jgi:hypothetical protein
VTVGHNNGLARKWLAIEGYKGSGTIREFNYAFEVVVVVNSGNGLGPFALESIKGSDGEGQGASRCKCNEKGDESFQKILLWIFKRLNPYQIQKGMSYAVSLF